MKRDDPWPTFYELWQRLLWWERQLLLWFGYLSLGRRAILPALSWQAGAVMVVMWWNPEQPLLYALVFVVASVYGLLLATFLRK